MNDSAAPHGRKAGLPLLPPPVGRVRQAVASLFLIPKREILRRRLKKTRRIRIHGLNIVIRPDVFDPVIFRTGRYFAEFLSRMPPVADKKRALDMGTGSAILALMAARAGYRSTGVDISEAATACARENVYRNNLEEWVDIRTGDLFEPVSDEQFDLVLCSLPKFRGMPQTEFEVTWRATDVIDRFAKGLSHALKDDGVAFILLTTHGDDKGMIRALQSRAFALEAVARRHFGNEIMTIYRARKG